MRITRGPRSRTALVLGLAAGIASANVDRGTGAADREAADSEAAASLRLVLNTAAYRLHVYENGERIRSYRVAVGKPGHRTPRGAYHISRVIWNPWWHPPNRPWARGKRPVPPGPRNPMGRVKLYFRNLYYIHGTPYRRSLGRPTSHGCVRMANADVIELARLVHEHGSPNVPRSLIDRLVANPRMTRTIWLQRPVPFRVVARRAEVFDGRLEVYAGAHGDRPGLKAEVLAALADAGLDAQELDARRIEHVLRMAGEGDVSVPLSTLRAPTAAGPALG
ncbi:MAG TPA: L,D-transpeptidase [Longimicrobiales bacterium]